MNSLTQQVDKPPSATSNFKSSDAVAIEKSIQFLSSHFLNQGPGYKAMAIVDWTKLSCATPAAPFMSEGKTVPEPMKLEIYQPVYSYTERLRWSRPIIDF